MQLHSMIVDDFLSDYEAVRKWGDSASYGSIASPFDGVTYPGICSEIPPALASEVEGSLCRVLATNRVEIKALFARLSTEGTPVPHQAHNDAGMGMFTMILYLNRDPHIPGNAGTDLIDHNVYDMEYGPRNDAEQQVWREDMNIRKAWYVKSRCPMKPNRAFIFDSRLMHWSAPSGGFGSTKEDGRLVLSCFFDLPC